MTYVAMFQFLMLDTFLTMNGSKIEGYHVVLAELRCPGGSIGTYTTTNLSRNLKHGFTFKLISDASQFFVKCKLKNFQYTDIPFMKLFAFLLRDVFLTHVFHNDINKKCVGARSLLSPWHKKIETMRDAYNVDLSDMAAGWSRKF